MDVFWFDMYIVRHAEHMNYYRRLVRFFRSADIATDYRRLDVPLLQEPINGFHLVKSADAF